MTIRLRPLAALVIYALATASPAAGQTLRSVTREAARRSAVERAPRLLIARSDTLAASAAVLASRLYLDPTASLGYSRSTPRYHAEISLPIDLPWIRNARTAAAQSGRLGSGLRLEFARAAARLAADTAYTAALAARELLALGRRNLSDADSLLHIATIRRDAGDASDLDVELARILSLQQANDHAVDSLRAEVSIFTLQAAMGLAVDTITIVLADSLNRPSFDSVPSPMGVSLQVAAAQADLRSAELAARLQQSSRLLEPVLTAGFETGDPGGSENGLLPTIGLSIPLPLLNRNRGSVALAEAEVQRAHSTLAAVQVETGAELGRARRAYDVALAQLDRDEVLVTAAERVSTMSFIAYREGAATLASVLEAQRTARDIRAQYVADLAGAWIAHDTFLLLTATVDPSVP
ncbi:MAG: TolC family protein [Gemmatimonadales bacterium]